MRLLLLASTPVGSSTLGLDREISALQRRFLDVSREPFDFTVLPDERVDTLPLTLRELEPDILHVAAHGETSHLLLARAADGAAVKITPEGLREFLSPDRPPRLVYLNGCKLAEMAKGVLGPVAMAVGTAATIDNGPARATAAAFYERVLRGDSVQTAFAAAKAMAAMLGGVDLELHASPGVDPANEVLRPRPRLVARFTRAQQAPDGTFPVCIGVAQCPKSATQLVVFFESETATCASTRPEWEGSTAWLRTELRVDSDRRLFVVCLIGGAAYLVVEARFCEALIDTERKDVRFAMSWLLKHRHN